MSILIVASGSVIEEAPGKAHVFLNRGEAMATPSGTSHRLRFTGDDCRVLSIRVPPALAKHVTNVRSAVRTPPSLVSRIELEIRSRETWRDISIRGLFLRLIANLSQTDDRQISATMRRTLVDVRAARAAELLSKSSLPLDHIARACGFFDSSHLIRAFEVRYGVKPNAFRESFERVR